MVTLESQGLHTIRVTLTLTRIGNKIDRADVKGWECSADDPASDQGAVLELHSICRPDCFKPGEQGA